MVEMVVDEEVWKFGTLRIFVMMMLEKGEEKVWEGPFIDEGAADSCQRAWAIPWFTGRSWTGIASSC